MPRYNEEKNVGLPYKFTLEDGKFKLIGGELKVQDNISMTLGFMGFFRTYFEDFVPDVLWLLQKPTSIIQSFKTLILGRFVRSLGKYSTNLKVEKINIQYEYTDRKTFGVAIQWTYALDASKSFQTIKFVQPS